jgi:hypothetical protein
LRHLKDISIWPAAIEWNPEFALPNFDRPLPYCFVWDNAFPLRPDFMIPTHILPQEDNIFNYPLSRARRFVENAFAILSDMWRILRRLIQASPETVNATVLGAGMLFPAQLPLSYKPGLVNFKERMEIKKAVVL